MRTKSKDSYLELLFENRNKEYGAYELRCHYNERLLKAFGYALFFASLVFLIPYVLTLILTKPKLTGDILKGELIYTIQPPFVFDKPEQSITHTGVKTITENNYRIVKAISEPKKKEEVRPEISTNTNPVENNGLPSDNSKANISNSDNPPVDAIAPEIIMSVAAVDKAPSFPGGESALMNYLNKNIHFTRQAIENNIAGKIHVSFVINEMGEIINVKLMNLLEASLDREVLVAINNMPKWSPGIYHGQAVKTAFNLPVSFNLK